MNWYIFGYWLLTTLTMFFYFLGGDRSVRDIVISFGLAVVIGWLMYPVKLMLQLID